VQAMATGYIVSAEVSSTVRQVAATEMWRLLCWLVS
jgi:hypothetical protein